MKKILVFGSSNIDYVLNVAEMPKNGETVRSTGFCLIPGGKGANQACACGRLGGDCIFLGAVGKDGNGEALIASLERANVDCRGMRIAPDTPTGMAIIPVDSHGENRIIIVPGANALCNDAYLQSSLSLIQHADLVLTQLETPLETVYALIRFARDAGKTVVLNPAPAVPDLPTDLYPCVDCITPNETELAILSAMPVDTEEEIIRAARVLIDRGVGHVIVTVGKQGAIHVHAGGTVRYPAFPTVPVDTTAAGDTFSAALAVALASGLDLAAAIPFGNAAASLTVGKKGAQTSIPNRAEVMERLYQNEALDNTEKEKTTC